MTMAAKGSSAAASRSETSMLMAVGPVTSMSVTPYFFSSSALWSRSSVTRRAVEGAFWPPTGITWIRAVSALWLGVAWGTATTPGS